MCCLAWRLLGTLNGPFPSLCLEPRGLGLDSGSCMPHFFLSFSMSPSVGSRD